MNGQLTASEAQPSVSHPPRFADEAVMIALIEMHKSLITMLIGAGALSLEQLRLMARQTPQLIRSYSYDPGQREAAAEFVEYVYARLPWTEWERILNRAEKPDDRRKAAIEGEAR
jgi:hypothetical protein